MKKLLNFMLVMTLAISVFAFTETSAASSVYYTDSDITVEYSFNSADFSNTDFDVAGDYFLQELDYDFDEERDWQLFESSSEDEYNVIYMSTEIRSMGYYITIVDSSDVVVKSFPIDTLYSDLGLSVNTETYFKITLNNPDTYKIGMYQPDNDAFTEYMTPLYYSFEVINPNLYSLDHSSDWLIEYDDQVALGEDLEVTVTLTDMGAGIEKFYEAYFVNNASSQIDVAGNVVDQTGDYSGEDEATTFTINTSGQAPGTYTFQISRLDVEYQGANETLYPSVTIGNLEYTIVSAPEITLVGNENMLVEYDSTFTDPGATASDAEDGDLTSSITTSGTVDTSTLGTYTITYSVEDASGNTVSIDRTISVVDSTKPVITLTGGANIDVFVDSTYTDAGATAADAYDGDITDDIVATGTVDTATAGTYFIVYQVTDSNGNDADAVTRQINVVDAAAPTITITGDATINIEAGGTFTDPGATASDDTDGNLTSSIVVTGLVNTNVVGTYYVYYNVEDSAGNDAIQKVRTINVVDTTAPDFELVGDATVYVEVGTDYSELGVLAVDAYDGNISNQVEISGDTIDTTTIGTYVLSYDIEDANGNAATTITRSVVVRDTAAPTISVSGATTLNSEAVLLADLITPSASDLYDGILTNDITITLDEYTGNETRVGSYDVTYSVEDASGNTATKTITITVVDDAAPTIAGTSDFIDRETYNAMDQEDLMNYLAGTYIPGNINGTELILINDLENPLTLADITALMTAADTEDGDLTADITVSLDGYTGNEETLGEFYVTYSVQDSGNQTTQRMVTIINVDFLSPVISYSEESLSVPRDGSMTLADLEIMIVDNVDGDITNQAVITGWSLVDFTTIGDYEVQIDVVDASGNASQVVLTISVVDDVAPVLTGPDAFIKHPNFIFNAQNLLSYYTATDDTDGDITANIEMLSNELLGNADDPGTYNVVLRIEDAAGNATLIEITVQVDADLSVYLVADNNKIVVDAETPLETQDVIDLLIYIDDIADKVYIPTVNADTYTEDAAVPGTYELDVTLNSADGNEYNRVIEITVSDGNIVSIPGVIVIPGDGSGALIFGVAWYYIAIPVVAVLGIVIVSKRR